MPATASIIMDPFNWYWKMDGSDTQVWWTKTGEFVPVNDSTYQRWLANGYPEPIELSWPALYNIMIARGNFIAAAKIGLMEQANLQPSQIADALLRSGCAISFVSASVLNGVYAVDERAQARITAIAAGIAAGKGLPGEASTIPWPDVSGVPHNFTADQFTDFAAAVRDYVFDLYTVEAALLGGVPANWPSQPVQIG